MTKKLKVQLITKNIQMNKKYDFKRDLLEELFYS